MSGSESMLESKFTRGTTGCCCCCSRGSKSSAEVSELWTTRRSDSALGGCGNLRRGGLTGRPKNKFMSRRIAARARLRRLRQIRLLSALLSLSLMGLVALMALRARCDAVRWCQLILLPIGDPTIGAGHSTPTTQTRCKSLKFAIDLFLLDDNAAMLVYPHLSLRFPVVASKHTVKQVRRRYHTAMTQPEGRG